MSVHETVHRWAGELNKELQSCYTLLSIGCCNGTGEKDWEVSVGEKWESFALKAARCPLAGQL